VSALPLVATGLGTFAITWGELEDVGLELVPGAVEDLEIEVANPTNKTWVVYQSIDEETGLVDYVGITSNYPQRHSYWGGAGRTIAPIPGLSSLGLGDARAIEQYLIDTYGLGKNGGLLLNKINSISPTRDTTFYLDSLFRGQELLNDVGYEYTIPGE